MTKKKIYISGCGGMLGDAFYNTFKNEFELKCTDINDEEDWISFLDINKFEDYKKDVFSFYPNYLFHLGAYTDLEFCELNPEKTYITNTKSVEKATQIANQLNIPILYISTAGIFDGKKQIYDESDTPNPLGHYAKSKYFGELYVQKNANKFIICRAGWMMGGGIKKDKKFVNKILKQIKSGLNSLNVVNDKIGTPTYTIDFAKNVKKILELEYWGLYNLVCEGFTSRIEVCRYILDHLKLSSKININEVNTSFFKDEYFAIRPDSEQLINKKLNQKSINFMRDWKLCLSEYLDKDFKDYI
ncbi:MAG: dTDP-4-dehydrorhamnose reductase [Alphaproteobacteria bacterium MarineAlpha5_Bin11]|nr:MAG: dTDP-4-dehydrorhamnose reductase [Alphaproteobacteria bacterium MarineAlpha5_Bin11]